MFSASDWEYQREQAQLRRSPVERKLRQMAIERELEKLQQRERSLREELGKLAATQQEAQP